MLFGLIVGLLWSSAQGSTHSLVPSNRPKMCLQEMQDSSLSVRFCAEGKGSQEIEMDGVDTQLILSSGLCLGDTAAGVDCEEVPSTYRQTINFSHVSEGSVWMLSDTNMVYE